jgi:hypothetical protein
MVSFEHFLSLSLISYVILNSYYRRGLDYSVFEVLFRFLTIEDCQQVFSRVCKSWRRFHVK